MSCLVEDGAHLHVMCEVMLSILGRGPVGLKQLHVIPKILGDLQRTVWASLAVSLGPVQELALPHPIPRRRCPRRGCAAI
jgi:hypothetical protein